MLTILHGDNTLQSRDKLAQLIDGAKNQGKQLIRLEAKKLQLADLEEALLATSLFGEEKLVVIEHLHSLPTSKRKKELINYLANSSEQVPQVILYEKRPLTATMIKKLGGPQTQEFKITKSLFKWLDSLGTSSKKTQLHLLQAALQSDGEHFCFLMLIRQVRLLIQAKDGGQLGGPPFMINKLKSQANKFSLIQLLDLHQKLFWLDVAQKTSTTKLPLGNELELLAINM